MLNQNHNNKSTWTFVNLNELEAWLERYLLRLAAPQKFSDSLEGALEVTFLSSFKILFDVRPNVRLNADAKEITIEDESQHFYEFQDSIGVLTFDSRNVARDHKNLASAFRDSTKVFLHNLEHGDETKEFYVDLEVKKLMKIFSEDKEYLEYKIEEGF